jgi:hypothetical protein
MFRRFKVEPGDEVFTITELEPTDRHPLNWGLRDGVTRESAFRSAQSQDKPVTVNLLNGETRDLGVVFDMEAFERACYSGYVGYGYSMSDGYYGPLSFEGWVSGFRSDPERELRYGNDTADYVKASLPSYLAAREEVAA